MANRTREREYGDDASALNFAIGERLKELNTIVPGVVVSYNRERRRADVKSSFTTVMTSGERIPPPLVIDVPVLFSQSRATSVLQDLEPGDPVLLAFSQRGLENWIDTYEPTDPDFSQMFAYGECIVLLGFGFSPGDTMPYQGAPKADAPFLIQRNTNPGGYLSLTDKPDGSSQFHIEGCLSISSILSLPGWPDVGGGLTDHWDKIADLITRVINLEANAGILNRLYIDDVDNPLFIGDLSNPLYVR